MKTKFDSTSISFPNLPGIPNLNLNFKLSENDKKSIKEIIIYSQNKRVLTSFQCCGNCTKHAIESLIDYRIFLVNKRMEMVTSKQNELKKIIDAILKNIEFFLSYSEKLDIERNHKELSSKLDELRAIILQLLLTLTKKVKIGFPPDLNRMIKLTPSK